jgi:preprotein translocase subunit SecB
LAASALTYGEVFIGALTIMATSKTSPQINASAELTLQRIYATVSSEVPNIPEVFEITEAPQLDIKLNVKSQPCNSKLANYVVELALVVTAIQNDKTVFLVEVQQGGLFLLRGFEQDALTQVINIHCPTILYPYASALVSDLVLRAGFLPLHLPPVDFNAMHEQKAREQLSDL